ncbi:MAG: transporter substrate-binding domain-containing protein [Actinomycetes bacterium]
MVGAEPGFIQAANGQWGGYCAVIDQQIAKDLNLKPVPVVTTWGTMALDLETNKIDIADCAQPTGQRALVVDYTTHPIYTNYFSLVVRNPNIQASSWAQLDNKNMKIGVTTGSSAIQPIKMFAPLAQIVSFPSRPVALLALQNGQIDVYGSTLLESMQAVHANTALKARVVVPDPLVAAPSAVMVARSGGSAFLHAVDAVVWNLNSSGFDRSAILAALSTYGITAADLPANAPL